MCEYLQSDHALIHWNFVFQFCYRFSFVDLPDQEIDDQYSDTITSILSHIYHLIASCTSRRRIPLNDKKVVACVNSIMFQNNLQKIYTRKELVMMNTTISYFCTSFYIPANHKLVFALPHVQILGTNHCGDSRQTTFKHRESFQDVLCCHDFSYRVVAIFAHQIHSEYYCRNISVYIGGILLEHFSTLPKALINASTK